MYTLFFYNMDLFFSHFHVNMLPFLENLLLFVKAKADPQMKCNITLIPVPGTDLPEML